LTLTVVEKTKIKTFKQWQFDHMLYVIFLWKILKLFQLFWSMQNFLHNSFKPMILIRLSWWKVELHTTQKQVVCVIMNFPIKHQILHIFLLKVRGCII
jgi:hypothetical protein